MANITIGSTVKLICIAACHIHHPWGEFIWNGHVCGMDPETVTVKSIIGGSTLIGENGKLYPLAPEPNDDFYAVVSVAMKSKLWSIETQQQIAKTERLGEALMKACNPAAKPIPPENVIMKESEDYTDVKRRTQYLYRWIYNCIRGAFVISAVWWVDRQR